MVAVHIPPCDRGLAQAAAGAAPTLSTAQKRGMLAATVLGSSLAFIDGSAVGVALPALQRGLGVGSEALQWVVNGYLLMLGALVLIGGAAADRFGRRRVFVVGIAVFTAASAFCALAPTAAALIAARFLQGLGAALLTPASLAILGAGFPEAERGRAVGAWAGLGALASGVGPVLAGWLADSVSWRAIFLINLPIALAAVVLALRYVPESRAEATPGKRLDLAGALLATAGLGLVTWGLSVAGAAGLASRTALAAMAAGLAVLGVFAVVEFRAANPMAPPALFRSAPFTGANLLTLLLYFALGGALFFLPFELIRVRGASAAMAGAALLPFSLVMGLLSGAAGRLADRIGPHLPLIVGPLIAAAGLAALAFTGAKGSYWTGLLPATLGLAAGMTLAVAPLTPTVVGAVDRDHAGTASGINNAVARIAGLLAVAALTLVFTHVFDTVLSARAGAAGALPPQGQALAVTPASAAPALQGPERTALDAAYRAVMLVAAGAAALSAVPAAVMIRGRGRSGSAPRPAPSPRR
jgi:EmrB/QacA subfamily drug resistance transporter